MPWTYPLAPGGVVRMLPGSKIVGVCVRDGQPYLIALVPEAAHYCTRYFIIRGDGQAFIDNGEAVYDYIGSFTRRVEHLTEPRTAPQDIAYHVFEIRTALVDVAHHATQEKEPAPAHDRSAP